MGGVNGWLNLHHLSFDSQPEKERLSSAALMFSFP